MNCLKCRSKTKLKIRSDGEYYCEKCGQKLQKTLNLNELESEVIMNKMLHVPGKPSNSSRLLKICPTQDAKSATNTTLLQECDPEEFRERLRSEYLNQSVQFPPSPPPVPTVAKSDQTIKTSEQLIKEQLLSQVMSNFKCPDQSFLSANNVDTIPAVVPEVVNAVQHNRKKFIENYVSQRSKPIQLNHPNLLSKSLPPPLQIRAPLIKSLSSAAPRPQSSGRQPIPLSDKHYDHNTGQDKTDKGQEMDPMSFVDFIKQKFNNMSLSHIQSIISTWPNSVTDKDKSQMELHTLSKSEPISAQTCPSEMSSSVSQIARRASINLKILNHNEPGDQHIAIESFKHHPTQAPFLQATAEQQHIPRTPIICPITECTCSSVFVSEFAKHVRVNHVRVPTEVVQPDAGTNLFVDTELDELNMSRCRMMYLVTGKIHSLGSSRYKHYLPVLLMTARIDLHKMLQPGRPAAKSTLAASNLCTLVWLTGLYASDQPLHYTLSAWHRRGNVPNTHLVHSGRLYSIRSGQEPADVFRSGHGMVLTRRQMADLSESGESLIKMQVILY